MSGIGRLLKTFAGAGAIVVGLSHYDLVEADSKIPVPKDRPPLTDIELQGFPKAPTKSLPNNIFIPQGNIPVPKTRPDLKASFSQSNFIHYGARTSMPIGAYEFCKELPAECDRRKDEMRVVWNDGTEKMFSDINIEANWSILPKSDMEKYHKNEVWTYPTPGKNGSLEGDCEDFVLYKRNKLREIGVPDAAMSIAVVMNGDEGHAVLVVRTTVGDKILNNLTDDILFPGETGLKFIKATSFVDGQQWQNINIDEDRVASTGKKPNRKVTPTAQLK